MSAEVNLLDFDADGLAALMAAWGEKTFRARQLMHWIHQNGCDDFSLMTDIAKVLREKLQQQAHISAPRALSVSDSADGTQKWLFDVDQGNAVEAVFIPERGRGTLCISTQAGCVLDCAFCATGKQGFNRNLTAAEIIGQLWAVNHSLLKQYAVNTQSMERPVTNVVFMGMGEPLANFDHVVTALNVMISDHAYGLSRRRLTVSTSGIVPAIDRLREVCPVALAVSLHAPDDVLRDELVPINRKYPLKDLMEACRRYLEKAPRDFITFEYVMLDGVNDGDQEIRQLIRLTRNIPCKFNLIPFNPFPGTSFRCSSPARISHFMDQLMRAGKVTTVRRTRGNDVDAACGQLAGRIKDKSKRTLRLERVE